VNVGVEEHLHGVNRNVRGPVDRGGVVTEVGDLGEVREGNQYRQREQNADAAGDAEATDGATT